MVRDVINLVGQIGVCEDITDDFPGVSIPELILGSHPFGSRRVFWKETIVLNGIRLPGDVPKFDRINHRVEFMMVDNRRGIIVGNEGGPPKAKEAVDVVI